MSRPTAIGRLAAAVETFALVLLVGAALGVFDGLRAPSQPGESDAARVLTLALVDAALLAVPGLAFALGAALLRPVAAGWRLRSLVALLLPLGFAGALAWRAASMGLPEGATSLAGWTQEQPGPLLRVDPGEGPGPVVLVSLDTVRADALMPRLAARGGLRYTAARSPSSWTLSAMASAHTGLLPHQHGAGRRLSAEAAWQRTGLSPSPPTLAEQLRDRGYVTLAVLTNPYLSARYGMTRGFDRAWDLTRTATLRRALRRSTLLRATLAPRGDGAAAVTDRALEVLERAHAGRFLLWVHYLDAHAPYTDDAARDTLAPCALPACFGDTAAVRRGERVLDQADQERVRALYAADVDRLDAQVDRLLAGIFALDTDRRALVVVLADHGEELWDHGGVEHGDGFYDEVVRVPLVVFAPGRGAAEVSHAVTLTQLPEVVRAWTDRGELGPWEPGAPDARAPMSSLLFGEEGAACVAGGFKAISRGERLAVYDLVADPGETRDLGPVPEAQAALDCVPPLVPEALGEASADPALLQALGYVD